MKVIRSNVFETNSSSTHSITMCMKNEYDAWANGEVYLNDGGGWCSTSLFKSKQFVTKEEAIDILTNNMYSTNKYVNTMDDDELESNLRENNIYTYENYWSNDLEGFDDQYVTPHGDVVVSFGQFGYDG